MRRLLPLPSTEVDPLDCYAADDRTPPERRPWVLVNMVASADGATALSGVTGELGGEGDKAVFRAIRALPEVILAGAGTVRAEDYGPPRATAAVQAARQARGQAAVARLAVISARLDLDPGARLFTGDGPRPILLTTTDADPQRRAALAEVVDVVAAGTGRVDLVVALAELRNRGVRLVVAEGGPRLNAALLEADLVDEWCLSVDPSLVGGASDRLIHGATATRQALRLDRVLHQDGTLFLRYVRSA